jgi:phosphate transport system permease protein
MSVVPSDYSLRASTRRLSDRIGDVALRVITALAGLAAVVLLGAIVWKVIDLALPAIRHYGLSFITGQVWDPVKEVFGALPFIYGTAISSLIALIIATPLALAIAPLAERARAGRRPRLRRLARGDARRHPQRRPRSLGDPRPRAVSREPPRALAARPPRLHPALRRAVGRRVRPLHGGMILTIMIVPIIASICRELFLQVPTSSRRARSPSARLAGKWCAA